MDGQVRGVIRAEGRRARQVRGPRGRSMDEHPGGRHTQAGLQRLRGARFGCAQSGAGRDVVLAVHKVRVRLQQLRCARERGEDEAERSGASCGCARHGVSTRRLGVPPRRADAAWRGRRRRGGPALTSAPQAQVETARIPTSATPFGVRRRILAILRVRIGALDEKEAAHRWAIPNTPVASFTRCAHTQRAQRVMLRG